MAVSGDSLISYSNMGRLIRGAAFIIPFLVFLIFGIIPLSIVDTSVGQYYKKPIIEIYGTYSLRYIGNVFNIMLATFVLSTFYIYLMAYCLIYMYLSLFGDIPWIGAQSANLLDASAAFFRNDIMQFNVNNVGL